MADTEAVGFNSSIRFEDQSGFYGFSRRLQLLDKPELYLWLYWLTKMKRMKTID